MADLHVALGTLFSPHAADHEKQAAQNYLNAFKASDGGLHWAITVLDGRNSPPGSLQEASWWLSADIATFWCRYKAVGPTQQQLLAALRPRLWAWLQGGQGLPYFVQSKLAAALASLACLTWPTVYPEFWQDLQQCLGERHAVGLQLLGALLDEYQALSQATSAGFRGRVRSWLLRWQPSS